jgi:malate dehydrogenase
MEGSIDQKSLKRLSLIRNQLKKNAQSQPLRVLVTGASGNIGYAITFMIAQGRMLGDQPLILHLFDLPSNLNSLKGLNLELTDGSFENLKGIIYSVDPAIAFKDVDYAILCGAKPRTQGMERKDLLSANAKIFEEQGKYFEKYARNTVKVCVVGNPANTNALILSKNAPSINPRNFTALTRLDHNRAVAQISEKLNVGNEQIKNVTIWGNHSATQYPDVDYSYVECLKLDSNIKANVPVKSLLGNEKWVQTDFIKSVQQRGAEIIQARKLSSAASAASSACDHMRDWILGTSPVFKIYFNFRVHGFQWQLSQKENMVHLPTVCSLSQ